MLESELFALLEQTADAAYSVTGCGEICSWNRAAARLFGYAAADVVGTNIDALFEARDTLGTDALAGGREAASRQWDGSPGCIPTFDLEVATQAGDRIWLSVSTIVFENARTSRRLFIRLARDVTQHRRQEQHVGEMVSLARRVLALSGNAPEHSPVDSLSEQERRILTLFAKGGNSAAVAGTLDISVQTLRNHLHHINRKLRTHTRLEAVTHAQRRGLIE